MSIDLEQERKDNEKRLQLIIEQQQKINQLFMNYAILQTNIRDKKDSE